MAFDTLSNTTSDTVTTHTTVDASAFHLAMYVAILGITTPRLVRVSHLPPLFGFSLIGRSGAPSRSQDFIFSAVAFAHSGSVTVSGSLPPDYGTWTR